MQQKWLAFSILLSCYLHLNIVLAASFNPHPLQAVFAKDIEQHFPAPSAAPKPSIIYTIVLDPGHGGKDPGAIGRNGAVEKWVVLNIAKQLAKLIQHDPTMHVYLTRDGDYFIALRNRLALARLYHANVFISIHADAYFDNNAIGASVYTLSPHGATSEAARMLAQRQNYAELGQIVFDHLPDQSDMVRRVLIDLAQTAAKQHSILFGNIMLNTLDDISHLHHLHVEQAPFMVLKSPDIPSILVETGFITNPREEIRLTNPHYVQQLARAMYVGIKQFIKKEPNI